MSSEFKKAGIVIYGTNAEGKRVFIMPYSEGRFGYNDKYYTLPKGTLDKGEQEWAGAKRETMEETGIDIDKLMRNGYSGVKVGAVGHEPVDFTYIARSGAKRRTALFGIEVENIEKLAPYLKNAENANTNDFKVRDSIRDRIQDATKVPQFEDFVEWLRSGKMPKREWNKTISSHVIPALYPIREGKKTPFEKIEDKMMYGGKIETLTQWKEFWRDLPKKDYDELQDYLAEIKHAVKAIGIIKGDADIFKLDDKDTPLQFFQEGADIITAEDYLRQCQEMRYKNPDYDLAFCGGALHGSRDKQIKHSQLAGIGAFIPEAELREAGLSGLAGLHGQKQQYWQSTVKRHPDNDKGAARA